MFQNYTARSILSNNTNKLIGISQKGGIMTIIKGDISKNETSKVAKPTGLDRWNYIVIVNGTKQLIIISAHQSIRSKSSLDTLCSQKRRFFLARSIEICRCKLFIMNLTQLFASTIELGLEVILSVDANEHILKGKLDLQLQKLGL